MVKQTKNCTPTVAVSCYPLDHPQPSKTLCSWEESVVHHVQVDLLPVQNPTYLPLLGWERTHPPACLGMCLLPTHARAPRGRAYPLKPAGAVEADRTSDQRRHRPRSKVSQVQVGQLHIIYDSGLAKKETSDVTWRHRQPRWPSVWRNCGGWTQWRKTRREKYDCWNDWWAMLSWGSDCNELFFSRGGGCMLTQLLSDCNQSACRK